jgi:hypothetical protein
MRLYRLKKLQCDPRDKSRFFLVATENIMKRGAENYMTKDDGPHDDLEVLLSLTRTKVVRTDIFYLSGGRVRRRLPEGRGCCSSY